MTRRSIHSISINTSEPDLAEAGLKVSGASPAKQEDSSGSAVNRVGCDAHTAKQDDSSGRAANSAGHDAPAAKQEDSSGRAANSAVHDAPAPMTMDTPDGNLPFLMRPAAKENLWGGTQLRNDFNKAFDMDNLAETWECSTHKDGPSVAQSGPYRGWELSDVVRMRPDYVGEHPAVTEDGGLPILVKLIDARQQLSVQVHPDDDYAREHEGGQLGKTEMWYILHAEKDAELIYGFSHDIDKDTLRNAIDSGTLGKYFQRVKVRRGDVFYMPSGTVHGIGAGIVLAEIQESSNLTYRLYDYDRVDRNGRKRGLHIDKALDVAILKGSAKPRQPMRVLKYRPGWAQELLIRCNYFQVERVLLNTECVREMAELRNSETSFVVLLCVGGCCTLIPGGGEPLYIIKGDCVFVPARSVSMRFHGKAQFLRISC